MTGFGGFKGDISLPAASGVNSAADGIYTLEEAAALRRMGRWPLIQRVVTVTNQPSDQTLTAGAATFSVTANVNEGGTLTYQWYRQALGTGSFSAISNATTASLVLSGLTREANEADGYRVVISAVGAQSVTSDTATLLVPAANTPDAPTNVVGVVGDEQVALTWSAPANTGGAVITDYVIQYSSNTGTTWSTFNDSTSTSTSVTVTGLTNDTAYLFRVAAVNIAGNGAWSANSSSVTPLALVFAITEQPKNNFSATYNAAASFSVAATGFGTLSYQWEGYYYNYNTGNYGWNSLGTASTFSLAGNTSSNYGIDTYSTGGMMQLRVVVTDSADSSTRTSQVVRWIDYSMVSPYTEFYGSNSGYPSGTTNVNGTNYSNLSLQEDEGIYVSVYDYGYTSFDTSWYSSNAFTIKLQSSSNATTWTDVETFNYRGSGFYLNTSIAANFGVVYYRVLVTENWPLTVTNGTQSATRTAPQIVAGAYKVTWPPRTSKIYATYLGADVMATQRDTNIVDTYLGMDVMATQRNTNIVDTYLGMDVMATQRNTNIVDTYLGVDVLCAVGSTLGAPLNLIATAGDGEIAATWSSPGYDGGSSITDYTVQYQAQSSSVSGDSLWSDVKLLLPLDSNFVDASTTNTTFTALGGATIDTANKQFGAGALPVGGFPAGYGISTTSAPAIGTNDFTLEWWQSFAAPGTSSLQTVLSWNAANFNTAYFQVRRYSNTQWAVEATRYDNIDETYRNTQLIFTNPSGWAHIAIVRQSGTWRVYVNGVQAASEVENSVGESFSGVSGPLSIPGGNVAFGRAYGGSGGSFAPAGYIDDIRLTLAARYPSGTTFTAPTSAHYTSAPSAGGPGAWTTFADGTSTSRAATVTGLANGNTYKIRVAAVNADGTGPYVTSGSYALVALPVITQQPKNDYATTSTEQVTFSVTATIATGDLTYQWQYYGADYNNNDYDYRWRNISDATASSFAATGNIMSNLMSYDFWYTGTAQLRCAISASGGGAPKYTVTARFMQLNNLHYPSTNWYGNFGTYTDWGGSFQTMSPQSGESVVVSVYDYAMSSPDTSWYTGNDTTLKIQVATTGATNSDDWTDLHTVDSRGYVYLPSYEITPSTGIKYYRVIAVNKWPYATNNGTSSVAHETQYVYPYDSSSAIRVTWP